MNNRVIALPELPVSMSDRVYSFFSIREPRLLGVGGDYAITKCY